MFEEFFRDNAPADIEELSPERKADIKAAVMKRVSHESEDKTMKKHNIFRPLLIAAAAVSVSAVSLVTANAATDGAVVDGITKMFTIIVNGEEIAVEAKYSEYDEGDMHIEQYEFEIPVPESEEGAAIGIGIISSSDCEEDVINFDSLNIPDITVFSGIELPDDVDMVTYELSEEELAEFMDMYVYTTSEVTLTWESTEDEEPASAPEE